MAAKPASRKWIDVQMSIAAISMTAALGFWNMFAGPDRQKVADQAALEEAKVIPTPTEIVEPAPIVTMPPAGYTILYGGEAPKPQVIVQRPRGGGGNEGGGGGGGGGAVTSTGSS